MNVNSDRSTLRRVGELLLLRERLQLSLLLFCTLVSAALDLMSVSLLVPILLVLVGDVANSDTTWLQSFFGIVQDEMSVAIALSAVFLLKNTVSILIVFIQGKIVNAINIRIVQRYYSNILLKPFEYHVAKSSPELMRDIQDRAYSVVNGAVNPFLSIFSDVLIGATLVAFLALKYPFVTFAVTIFLGITGVLLGAFTKSKLRWLGTERDARRGEQLHVLAESFSGIKDIIVRGNQSWFLKLHQSAMTKLAYVNVRFQVIQALPRSVFECAIAFTLVGLIFFILRADQSTGLKLGMIASFAFVAFRVLPSVQRISSAFQAVNFNIPLISLALNELEKFGEPPTHGTQDREASLEQPFSDLEFRIDEFRYPGSPKLVLGNVRFSFRKGELIAIVGESGSGKSTIVSLLVGLFKPNEGRILANGKSIFEDLDDWRKRIGFVPQDIFLLDGTILENVVFGEHSEAYDERLVLRALDRASIGDFVRTLPNGIHERIGEDGVRISGGQRQRLGFARALFRDPEILILDEATSALDQATEGEIFKLIMDLRRDLAIVMVTHRTSVFSLCDRVFNLRNGQLSCIETRGRA